MKWLREADGTAWRAGCGLRAVVWRTLFYNKTKQKFQMCSAISSSNPDFQVYIGIIENTSANTMRGADSEKTYLQSECDTWKDATLYLTQNIYMLTYQDYAVQR